MVDNNLVGLLGLGMALCFLGIHWIEALVYYRYHFQCA